MATKSSRTRNRRNFVCKIPNDDATDPSGIVISVDIGSVLGLAKLLVDIWLLFK